MEDNVLVDIDLERIDQFRRQIKIFEDHDCVTHNIEVYQSHRPLFPFIEKLLRSKCERLSFASRVQDDAHTALRYSIDEMLVSELETSKVLLDQLFDEIPSIRLLDYSVDTVCNAHSGYFLKRYEQELIEVSRDEANNRKVLGYNLYITHVTLREIADQLPEMATRVLPLFISDAWNPGFRVAAAKALYEIGNRDQIVYIWRALGEFDLFDPVLSSIESDPFLKEWIEYQVSRRRGSQDSDELKALEPYLAERAASNPGSDIAKFANNKWQGAEWSSKIILLKSGWEFKFRRAPYIESCNLRIPGGEVARDDVRPVYTEQKEWLDTVLETVAPGKYGVSWEIDYSLLSESALQALLIRIRALDLESEEDHMLE